VKHKAGGFVLAALFGTLGAALCLAGLPTNAAAQTAADKYPDRPIKIIVPFAPGGSTDIIARVIGQKMTENWGQTVVVETRPGAATIIGTQAAANAEPDGTTLLLTVSNHATNPSLRDKMPYDGIADFEFISMVTRIPIIPYTNPKFEPTNLKELIALAKAKPGSISFGSAGAGSMTHLVAEMLKLQAGIEMTHVVYRGGQPAMNDVLAGQIPMTFGTVVQALPQYQAGLMRALAVTAARHRLDPYGDPAAARRGGERVADQVEHDLLQLVLVGVDRVLAAVDLEVERDAAAAGLAVEQLEHRPGGPGEIARRDHRRAAAAERQQLLDDPRDPRGLLDEDLGLPAGLGIRAAGQERRAARRQRISMREHET